MLPNLDEGRTKYKKMSTTISNSNTPPKINITEILLKVALSTIPLTLLLQMYFINIS
jgi:hypothetical protein